MKNTVKVEASSIPQLCYICEERLAKYDAKTIHGSWAYLCNDCFFEFGIGLGEGLGQKIIYEDEQE